MQIPPNSAFLGEIECMFSRLSKPSGVEGMGKKHLLNEAPNLSAEANLFHPHTPFSYQK